LEFKQMLLDRGMPTKADEFLQERLHLLIKFYYKDRIPLDSNIISINFDKK